MPERTLLLGWNRRGPMIAFELSRYVAPGSVLTIAGDTPELQDEVGAFLVRGDVHPEVRIELPRDACATSSGSCRAAILPVSYPPVFRRDSPDSTL